MIICNVQVFEHPCFRIPRSQFLMKILEGSVFSVQSHIGAQSLADANMCTYWTPGTRATGCTLSLCRTVSGGSMSHWSLVDLASSQRTSSSCATTLPVREPTRLSSTVAVTWLMTARAAQQQQQPPWTAEAQERHYFDNPTSHSRGAFYHGEAA